MRKLIFLILSIITGFIAVYIPVKYSDSFTSINKLTYVGKITKMEYDNDLFTEKECYIVTDKGFTDIINHDEAIKLNVGNSYYINDIKAKNTWLVVIFTLSLIFCIYSILRMFDIFA